MEDHATNCQSRFYYMVGGIGDLNNPPKNRAVHYSCDCGLGDNNMDTDDYLAACEGRLGSDRMALKLSIIPDKNRGDMDEVARLRARVAELEAEIERRHGIGGELIIARRERDMARAELAAAKEDAEQWRKALAENRILPVGSYYGPSEKARGDGNV